MTAFDERSLATALELEHAVWEALRTGDTAADERLLADDFLGVYPTGFAGRDDHAGQLDNGPTIESYRIDRPAVRVITGDDLLLSYMATYNRTADAAAEVMYVSSLWQRRSGQWRNTFSQDTTPGDAVP